MPNIFQRLQHSWNAFRGRDRPAYQPLGMPSYYRPDMVQLKHGNERSIITAIYNRIAMDVASNKIEHVRLDDNGRYLETIKSYLNECLTIEANIDQTSRAFIQDVALTMFDEGCAAIVPTIANADPTKSGSFEIKSMRVGKVVQWFPEHVMVELYNEYTGKKDRVLYPKRIVALPQNPFYSVMNEPSSTLQRLIHKLNLLDSIDEQSGAGKLDLIIQLPYVVRSPVKKEQAEARRKDIENQLAGSKYGIAYTDGTEKITQLNRPVENNLLKQIEYLTDMVYSQLGITPEILNDTASEDVMNNYTMRTVEPVLSAIVDEMKRKFLTKTARSQGQTIMISKDPFKLVPTSKVADIAEKFVGNEILSPNEVRGIVGYKPSDDPKSDELRNRRLNQESEYGASAVPLKQIQNGSSNEILSIGQSGLDKIADLPISELGIEIEPPNTT